METLKNLGKAFIGESQARNRYTFYAKTAKKEGLPQISALFLLTAENEAQHAKWLMRMINELSQKSGEPFEVNAAEVPTVFADTASNLAAAIEGEHHEQTQMYPTFAKVAREEGLEEIADRLEAIAKAERHHEERYAKLLENLKNNTLFKKESEVEWVCLECGYVHKGTQPPEECPSCSHPKQHFIVNCEVF